MLLHVEQGPATVLGCQQHGQRAVLLEVDLGDGIHDDPQANAHGVKPASSGAKRDARVAPQGAAGQEKPRVLGAYRLHQESVLKSPDDRVAARSVTASATLCCIDKTNDSPRRW